MMLEYFSSLKREDVGHVIGLAAMFTVLSSATAATLATVGAAILKHHYEGYSTHQAAAAIATGTVVSCAANLVAGLFYHSVERKENEDFLNTIDDHLLSTQKAKLGIVIGLTLFFGGIAPIVGNNVLSATGHDVMDLGKLYAATWAGIAVFSAPFALVGACYAAGSVAARRQYSSLN